MDTNARLALLRALFESLDNGPSMDNVLAIVERIQEHFEALDAALARGGALPKAWGERGQICEHQGSYRCPNA